MGNPITNAKGVETIGQYLDRISQGFVDGPSVQTEDMYDLRSVIRNELKLYDGNVGLALAQDISTQVGALGGNGVRVDISVVSASAPPDALTS
jgi:hypothetical protein